MRIELREKIDYTLLVRTESGDSNGESPQVSGICPYPGPSGRVIDQCTVKTFLQSFGRYTKKTVFMSGVSDRLVLLTAMPVSVATRM